MARPGTWKPGQSGNPKGRPPKNRALTELLEAAGEKTIQYNGGKYKTARKRIIADLAWSLATTGEAELPGGKKLKLDPKDWMSLVKWIYQHIDGAPRSEVDLQTDGSMKVIVEYANGDDSTEATA